MGEAGNAWVITKDRRVSQKKETNWSLVNKNRKESRLLKIALPPNS
jgi:hypothetical protein